MSLIRKVRNLYDSIEGASFSNSNLKSEHKSALIGNERSDKTRSSLEDNIRARNQKDFYSNIRALTEYALDGILRNRTDGDSASLEEFNLTEDLEVSSEGYHECSDSFPDSEPYEEGIFYDVRREDRICVQCEPDLSFNSIFKGIKTSIERIPELFSLDCTGDADKNTTDISTDNRNYDSIYTQALTCRHCNSAVIAELDPEYNLVSVFDYEPYLGNNKVLHRHPADAKTRVRVLERVAAEKRLLEDKDTNDYHGRRGGK